MVARIVTGKSIKGAIRYNEQKVAKGAAEQIMAYNFPADNLSLLQKTARFQVLTSQRPSTKTNAVHISLNFDPDEKLDNLELQQIAISYLDKIGFSGQPFLLYRHFDAAHPHIHLVTTNIRDGGQRISLHNIGKEVSEPARKEIEREFGLVIAEGKGNEHEMYLKPIAAETAIYGVTETKASISNVLRSVIPEYKFTSLAELNAVLRLYNVTADPGSEGTKMQLNGGLQYSIIDEQGKKIGVPIKASRIFVESTLAKLQKQFEKNKANKKGLKDGLRKVVDHALRTQGVDSKEQFISLLQKENVSVILRENDQGRLYGITFVDHQNKVVFNGSELGKEYGASRLLHRLTHDQKTERLDKDWNRNYVTAVLKNLDYSKGFASALVSVYEKCLRIIVKTGSDGTPQFLIGHYRSMEKDYLLLDKKWSAYLSVNRMTDQLSKALESKKELYLRADSLSPSTPTSSPRSAPVTSNDNQQLQNFIENFLNAHASNEGPVRYRPHRKRKKRHI